jgi:hypothetical protein
VTDWVGAEEFHRVVAELRNAYQVWKSRVRTFSTIMLSLSSIRNASNRGVPAHTGMRAMIADWRERVTQETRA